MKRKLRCILLVDDDESTNFLNQRVIYKADCTEKVVAFESGQSALNHLKLIKEEGCQYPELIFLDVNMPAMDGFEFLDTYSQLNKEQQKKVVLVMLTTLQDPDEINRAKSIDAVSDFKNKPLTKEMLQEILEKHFSDIQINDKMYVL